MIKTLQGSLDLTMSLLKAPISYLFDKLPKQAAVTYSEICPACKEEFYEDSGGSAWGIPSCGNCEKIAKANKVSNSQV